MRFLDAIKSMFTNKKDVVEVKKRGITFSTFIHSNYRLLYFDNNGSFIWMIIFNPSLYMEFTQLAEVIPNGFKTYPFEKEVIVLVPLTVTSIEHILLNMRFANNPFYNELCSAVSLAIPVRFFNSQILEKTPLKFFKITDKVIENYFEENPDDYFESEVQGAHEILPYQDGLFAKTFGVVACDYMPKIKYKIISIVNKLALYVSNYDVNSLTRIIFEHPYSDYPSGPVTYNMNYLEFLEEYVKADEKTPLGRALIDFGVMAQSPEYKDRFILDSKDLVPSIFQVTDGEEVDEVIQNDMESHNIPDTSKIDSSKFIR